MWTEEKAGLALPLKFANSEWIKMQNIEESARSIGYS
jgi:hypothetical protein